MITLYRTANLLSVIHFQSNNSYYRKIKFSVIGIHQTWLVIELKTLQGQAHLFSKAFIVITSKKRNDEIMIKTKIIWFYEVIPLIRVTYFLTIYILLNQLKHARSLYSWISKRSDRVKGSCFRRYLSVLAASRVLAIT